MKPLLGGARIFRPWGVHSRVNCIPEHSIQEDILVPVGGAILPAPAVPASTKISARLECVQGHVSAVNSVLGFLRG